MTERCARACALALGLTRVFAAAPATAQTPGAPLQVAGSAAPPLPAPRASTPPPPDGAYLPKSPFQDDVPCFFIPWPRCGVYPTLAFGVQGGAARTPVAWEQIVRPWVELGLLTQRSDWVDFGASFTLAYDSLESVEAWSAAPKLRLRMWVPYGFFGDVYAGPMFERFAYPGTETGTRVGATLGATFSFSDLLGLDSEFSLLGDLGGAGERETRFLLGARFSITTIGVVIAGVAQALGK